MQHAGAGHVPLVGAVCVIAISASLVGCLSPGPAGPGGRDYILSHDVYVEGTGASWVNMSFEGRKGTLADADVLPGATRVALGFGGGGVEVWTLNGTLLASLGQNQSGCAAASQFGGTVRFVDPDHVLLLYSDCIRIYGLDGSVTFEMERNNAVVWYPDVLISDGAKRIAALDNYDWVKVVDLETAEEFTVPINYNAISQFALTPDGRFVITVDGMTRFYRLDEGKPNGTLVAEFDVVGRLAFSDDGVSVFQDRTTGRGNQLPEIRKYAVSRDAVTVEAWSCYNPPGIMGPRPLCPRFDQGFLAAGHGSRVAWAEPLQAPWQDEDASGQVSGNTTHAVVVRLLDWGAPNATRGFQVGGTWKTELRGGFALEGQPEMLVRAFVMPGGDCLAVSMAGDYQKEVHLTKAVVDAVLPVVESHPY